MPLRSTLGSGSIRSLGLGNSKVKDPYFDKLAFTLPSLIGTEANTTAFIDSGTANTGGTGFTVNRTGNTHMGSYSPFNKRGYTDSDGWSYEMGASTVTVPSAVLTSFGGWNGRKNTIECWIKPRFYATGSLSSGIVHNYEATAANGRWVFGLAGTGGLTFAYTTSTSTENQITTTQTLELQKWSHVCLTVDGTTSTAVMYINGVGQTFTGLALSTQGTTYGTTWSHIGYGGFGGYHDFFYGLMSDFRWVNNLVYTQNFTPPTKPLSRIDGTLLLTSRNSRFIDNSANNNVMDVSANCKVSFSSPYPVYKPVYDREYEGGSAYFDGSSDYLTIPDNSALEIGSSEFCVELMFNPSLTTTSVLFGKRASSTNYAPILIYYTSTNVYVYSSTNGSSWDFINGTLIGTALEGSWNHVAVYRVGNNWYGSLNGSIVTLKSSTAGTLLDNTGDYIIGGDTNTNYFCGYITNVRMMIGSSPYTGTSAPVPTEPLTNITDTKLLLLMNNFNYYDPTRQHTIETIGTVPLVTTPSKWGNSVLSLSRSSGAVNALLIPTQSSLNYNKTSADNDLTIEFWIYPTSLNVTDGIIVQKDGISGTNYSQWKVALTSANTGNVVFSLGNPAGAASKQDVTSNTAVTINNWNHVVCQRSASRYLIYVNGVLAANAAVSVGATANSRAVYINNVQGGSSTTGVDAYLDGMRIVRGTSVYSGATITMPTGPFGNQ